jgi:hypothetical protein
LSTCDDSVARISLPFGESDSPPTIETGSRRSTRVAMTPPHVKAHHAATLIGFRKDAAASSSQLVTKLQRQR